MEKKEKTNGGVDRREKQTHFDELKENRIIEIGRKEQHSTGMISKSHFLLNVLASSENPSADPPAP